MDLYPGMVFKNLSFGCKYHLLLGVSVIAGCRMEKGVNLGKAITFVEELTADVIGLMKHFY